MCNIKIGDKVIFKSKALNVLTCCSVNTVLKIVENQAQLRVFYGEEAIDKILYFNCVDLIVVKD